MTLSRGLWVRPDSNGQGVTTLEARRAAGSFFYEQSAGVVRSGILTEDMTPTKQLVTLTSGLYYTLQPCTVIIGRSANEGAYHMTTQGTTNTPNVAAAPAAGLSRWDLIYIKQNDLDKSDGDNLPVLGVVQGTAASSPSKPTASVPAGALVLAEAQIFSGTASTAASPNTITQVWKFTALKGNPVPVRNTTERGEITAKTGDKVRRLDLDSAGRVLESWTGAAWVTEQRPPLQRVNTNAMVGTATGVQAKINSGEIQMIHFTGTSVVTTDASGYWSYAYPVAFPNGIFNAMVSPGDSSVGRADIHAIAGAPMTQTLTTLTGSIVNEAGIARANHTARINISVWGW